MAIYHMSVKTISRSAGRSATAAAAYRTGTLVKDERSGMEFDYTRRGGVEPDPMLLLPAGAPQWDRSALWNAAEQAEKRKNSTVAREFVIALPAELDPAARRDLAEAFARRIVERHGCVADVAIHAPSWKGSDKNHHSHILCSTRKLEPSGFTAKTRELDDFKTGEILRWREVWAEMVNDALKRHGVADRVDHRSHAARGLEVLPTIHEGPAAQAIERGGKGRSDRVATNVEIRALNAEIRQIAEERKELAAAINVLVEEAEREPVRITVAPEPPKWQEPERRPVMPEWGELFGQDWGKVAAMAAPTPPPIQVQPIEGAHGSTHRPNETVQKPDNGKQKEPAQIRRMILAVLKMLGPIRLDELHKLPEFRDQARQVFDTAIDVLVKLRMILLRNGRAELAEPLAVAVTAPTPPATLQPIEGAHGSTYRPNETAQKPDNDWQKDPAQIRVTILAVLKTLGPMPLDELHKHPAFRDLTRQVFDAAIDILVKFGKILLRNGRAEVAEPLGHTVAPSQIPVQPPVIAKPAAAEPPSVQVRKVESAAAAAPALADVRLQAAVDWFVKHGFKNPLEEPQYRNKPFLIAARAKSLSTDVDYAKAADDKAQWLKHGQMLFDHLKEMRYQRLKEEFPDEKEPRLRTVAQGYILKGPPLGKSQERENTKGGR